MLRIFLCDDDPDALKKYASMITQCAKDLQNDIELLCFTSGEALLFHLEENPWQADIIYLDIMMGTLDGMAAAHKLRDFGCPAEIVFLTTCEEYMNEAFDVHAVHYLLKDGLSTEKFEKVFADAVRLAQRNEHELFICEFDGCKTPVKLRNIVYFETWKRIITAYCSDGSMVKFYGNMNELEEQLSCKGFVRIHRSYLVHLPYIAQFQPRMLLLKTMARIPIGNTYRGAVQKAFSDYALRCHVI